MPLRTPKQRKVRYPSKIYVIHFECDQFQQSQGLNQTGKIAEI